MEIVLLELTVLFSLTCALDPSLHCVTYDGTPDEVKMVCTRNATGEPDEGFYWKHRRKEWRLCNSLELCAFNKNDDNFLLRTTSYYYFKVNSSRNHSTYLGKLKPYHATIIASPVKDIKVAYREQQGYLISWTGVTNYRRLQFSYHVCFKAPAITPNCVVVNEEHLDWKSYRPFTEYHITVQASERGTARWSLSRTLTLKTEQDVPGANPLILVYETVAVNNNKRTVKIYWQDIPQDMKHGEVTYRVSTVPVYNNLTIDSHEGRVQTCDLHLNPTQPYNISVISYTDKGSNTSLEPSTLYIPLISQEPSLPDKLRAISLGKDHIEVYWEKFNASIVSVFWCLKDGENCKGILEDKAARSEVGRIKIRFKEDRHEYRLGVSVRDSTGVWRGLHWLPCIYSSKQAPAEAEMSVQQMSESGLSVTWKKGKCEEGRGYTDHYHLTYCLKSNCVPITRVISGSLTTYEAPGLETEQDYVFTIQAVSPEGLKSPVTTLEARIIPKPSLGHKSIIGIFFAALVVFALFVIGVIAIYRRIKRKYDKFALKIEPIFPNVIEFDPLEAEEFDYYEEHGVEMMKIKKKKIRNLNLTINIKIADSLDDSGGDSDSGINSPSALSTNKQFTVCNPFYFTSSLPPYDTGYPTVPGSPESGFEQNVQETPEEGVDEEQSVHSTVDSNSIPVSELKVAPSGYVKYNPG